MGDLWRDLLGRPHVVEALGPEFEIEGRHTAWPIPARIDSIPLTSRRILYVGDAVGATDVMTGEGIGQALLTGRLAAEAIDRHHDGDDGQIESAYEQSVRDHLFADHRMSKRLGRVLEHQRGARGAIASRRRQRRMGTAQLRPLDVRGRTARDRHHAAPLAPPLPAAARAVLGRPVSDAVSGW